MSGVWLVLIGFASGIVSGMGIGGGAILIPALGIIFSMDQPEAQKINLLYFLPTAAIALRTHAKSGNIEKKGLLRLTLFGLMGAAAGALIAVNINAAWLRKGFAVFLLAMAAHEFIKGYNKWKSKTLKH